MTTLTCIACKTDLRAEHVNITADLAKCTSCGAVFKASSALSKHEIDSFRIEACPPGVRFEGAPDGFSLSATTRSASAFVIIPFTCVWAGMSMWGIYLRPLLKGEALGINWLFGIPFVIGSIILIASSAMSVAGTVRVEAKGYQGRVFVGVGVLGWTKRFSWREVDRAVEGQSSYQVNYRHRETIVLEGRTRINFGGFLNEARRYHLLRSIQALLAKMHRDPR